MRKVLKLYLFEHLSEIHFCTQLVFHFFLASLRSSFQFAIEYGQEI